MKVVIVLSGGAMVSTVGSQRYSIQKTFSAVPMVEAGGEPATRLRSQAQMGSASRQQASLLETVAN